MSVGEGSRASNAIFHGNFPDWNSACNASEIHQVNQDGINPTTAYDSDRWLDRQRNFLKEAKVGHTPRPTNLPLLAASVGAGSILDLGGGSGWTSELLFREKNQITRYVVFELPRVCQEFQREFGNDSGISFSGSVEDISKSEIRNLDILYCNSALQYFPDNTTINNLTSILYPKWVLLDDFITSSNMTFFSLQYYYGSYIPYRFTSLRDIEKTFSELGYELIVKSEAHSPISSSWEMKIEGDHKFESNIGPSFNLLFRRIASSN